MSTQDLSRIAKELRRDILIMLNEAGAGHPGGSLSEIDMLTALYFGGVLSVDAKNPKDDKRDRFILSKGHASPGMYATLAKKGFFDKSELMGFRKMGRLLQGHTDIKVPGVEMSAGSLGMGPSFGVGCALAAKHDGKDHKIWVMVGDGETQEGQVWEAAMNASFHKLDNLIIIIDRNGIQNDDFVKTTSDLNHLPDRWKAFGFEVFETDGHDMEKIMETFNKAKAHTGSPVAIIAHTVKGKGVSFMENNPKWHGAAPDDEQLKQALEELK